MHPDLSDTATSRTVFVPRDHPEVLPQAVDVARNVRDNDVAAQHEPAREVEGGTRVAPEELVPARKGARKHRIDAAATPPGAQVARPVQRADTAAQRIEF